MSVQGLRTYEKTALLLPPLLAPHVRGGWGTRSHTGDLPGQNHVCLRWVWSAGCKGCVFSISPWPPPSEGADNWNECHTEQHGGGSTIPESRSVLQRFQTGWLGHWLVGSLVGWVIGWLGHWLVGSLVGWVPRY